MWKEGNDFDSQMEMWPKLSTFLFAEQLAAVPEIAALGPLFKSTSKPIQLTESETEYVVSCIKHTFADHMVFQVENRSVYCHSY